MLRRPILVAEDSLVILDGHHRYFALKALGCTRVPAYVVDYASDSIRLTTWPGSPVEGVTKAEVIDRARAGRPFPAKTTRHRLSVRLEDRPVPLTELR